jgi:hypothetical protein
MDTFRIISGLTIAALGLYLGLYFTYQSWNEASLGLAYSGKGLGGPSIVILALSYSIKFSGAFSQKPILRYALIAIALVIGVANITALELIYPHTFSH